MAMITAETLTHTKPGVTSLLRGFANRISTRKQRAALAALDADQLKDLGLSREQALREAKRPVWDAPLHWLR